MPRWRASSVVFFFALVIGAGCAAISGIGNYQVDPCFGGCDGGIKEAAADGRPDDTQGDGAQGDDGSDDGAPGDDASDDADGPSASDANGGDGGVDSGPIATFTCLGNNCAMGHQCCLGLTGMLSCDRPCRNVPITCEDSDECTSGEVCCATIINSKVDHIGCAATCSGFVVCNADGGTCPTGACGPGQHDPTRALFSECQ
jgi:hypothetical protein